MQFVCGFFFLILTKLIQIKEMNIESLPILKFITFCVVGFSGMVIDFGITYLLKEKVKINKFLANSAGFISAATSNFFLNKIWTFHSNNPQVAAEYSEFIGIALVGLITNNFFLWIFNEKLKLNFYIAKFMAILLTTFWNFFANYYITFK